jgi:amidase
MRTITTDDVHEVADAQGFQLTADEAERYRDLVAEALASIEELSGYQPTVSPGTCAASRTDGSRPNRTNDPHNAWITKFSIETDDAGPLTGTTVGLKDSIAVAGYDMTCGSRMLEGFRPEIDATVVQRLLSAGATIVGKQNMDAYQFGATGEFGDFGRTRNPRAEGRVSGGSSSGSAAAVAAGECDVGIGTDQNGSVRVPSAWCGCVGTKPTYGLVPYTGVFSSEFTIDHVGPITETVADNARVLDAIAGVDRQDGVAMDPRQPTQHPDVDLSGTVEGPVDELRIGVVEEGFDRESGSSAVSDAVRAAVDRLETRGVTTNAVSIPQFDETLPIINAVMALGGIAGTFEQDDVRTNAGGWHWRRLGEAFAAARDSAGEGFSPVVKNLYVIASVLTAECGFAFNARAKNAVVDARSRLASLLSSVDALVTPTTPMGPHEIDESLQWDELIRRDATVMTNTTLFNHTGHPAVSVPCDRVDGAPVGMQLVGDYFGEATLFRLAAAVESDRPGG